MRRRRELGAQGELLSISQRVHLSVWLECACLGVLAAGEGLSCLAPSAVSLCHPCPHVRHRSSPSPAGSRSSTKDGFGLCSCVVREC